MSKKCYKFVLSNWIACPHCLAGALDIVNDWVKENDYKKIPLYIQDGVYVYSRDKDVIHLVIENKDGMWDDLPPVLEMGDDILEVILDAIADRDGDYDIEADFLDYLMNG